MIKFLSTWLYCWLIFPLTGFKPIRRHYARMSAVFSRAAMEIDRRRIADDAAIAVDLNEFRKWKQLQREVFPNKYKQGAGAGGDDQAGDDNVADK